MQQVNTDYFFLSTNDNLLLLFSKNKKNLLRKCHTRILWSNFLKKRKEKERCEVTLFFKEKNENVIIVPILFILEAN